MTAIAMTSSKKPVRVQFYVRQSVATKLDCIGARLGHTRTRAAASLLGHAAQQHTAGTDFLSLATNGAEQSPADGVVLMHVPLPVPVSQRIGRLAQDKGLSRAKVCARLLNRILVDELWVEQIVAAGA